MEQQQQQQEDHPIQSGQTEEHPDNNNNHSDNAQSTTTTTTTGSRGEYWCHQCQHEITPMMVPDPMCPNCHSEFVEKIEADNDPRTFVQPDPQLPPGLASQQQQPGQGPTPFDGPVNLDDLLQLFQAISNPQRMQRQQYMQQRQEERDGGETQIIFSSGPMSGGSTFSTMGSGFPPQRQQQQQQEEAESQSRQAQGQMTGGGGEQTVGTVNQGAGRDGQQQQEGHTQGARPQGQWHSPPAFFSGLLNRLGIEMHYTTDPAALQGPGFGSPFGAGPMGMGMGGGGGGFFPIVGNPGDYAWGHEGLDDIITRMMELQNRQHGPVGATEDMIESIPHHKLTEDELEASIECSVCKDEFTKEDNLLQLPCKHMFHEDCIKPWLKVSGTCPTCRFSLAGNNDEAQPDGEHPPSTNNSHSGENTSNTTTGSTGTNAQSGSAPSGPGPAMEPLD